MTDQDARASSDKGADSARRHGSLLRRVSLWFDAAVLILMVYVVYSSFSFETLASYLPLSAGVLGVSLASLNLVLKKVRPDKVRTGLEQIASDIPKGMTEGQALRSMFVGSAYYFAWFLGFVLLIWLVGFMPAAVVFLVAFLWKESDMGVVGILVSVLVVYGLLAYFADVMNFRWPASIFDLQAYLPFFS